MDDRSDRCAPFSTFLLPDLTCSLTGKPYSVFKPACTLTADLSSLIALSPIRGADSQYVQLDLRLVIYLGTSSLEARVAWKERVSARRDSGRPS